MRPFPPEEFATRVERVRKAMSKKGIDVLIISDANNMYWTTGYSETAAYQKTFIVIAQDDPKPHWIGREFTCAPTAELTTYLEQDQMTTFGEKFATHTIGLLESKVDEQETAPDAMGVVADYVKSRGWGNKRVGIEEASRQLPYRYGCSLRAGLPDATFVDATFIIEELRVVKSDLEVQVLRQSAAISNTSMRSTIEMIEPGVRECEVAAEVFRSNVAGTVDYGGFYPEGVVMNVGRRNPAMHSNWTDQPIPEGELITIEMGSSRYGYNVGHCRAAAIGGVDQVYLDLSACVNDAFAAVFEAAVAGNTSHNVATKFTETLHKGGFKARDWIAYSMGVGLPGQNWADPADIRLGNEQVLVPNMMFHIVPGFWIDGLGWTLLASDSFLIKETGGPELMSDVERKIYIR